MPKSRQSQKYKAKDSRNFRDDTPLLASSTIGPSGGRRWQSLRYRLNRTVSSALSRMEGLGLRTQGFSCS